MSDSEDEGEDEVVETKPPAAMIEDSSDEEEEKEPDPEPDPEPEPEKKKVVKKVRKVKKQVIKFYHLNVM